MKNIATKTKTNEICHISGTMYIRLPCSGASRRLVPSLKTTKTTFSFSSWLWSLGSDLDYKH